ncbi:MAG TPA: helix-turn-helix domain-containing protein, partial [Novosphingobium sp.]|nr:helix-turn-helix domain-containing protein [Novosphingobium sp.]
MPKKVDHARRRLDIARVAEGLVYDKGMDGLTMRDVARGMGCSLSVILHYFESKLDLLVFTHRL